MRMYGGAIINLNIKTLAGDITSITMDDSLTVRDLKREYVGQNPAMGSVAVLKLTVLHRDLPAVPAGSNENGFTELDDEKTLASYHFHSEQDLNAIINDAITFTIPAGYTMRYPPSYRDGGEWLRTATSIERLMLDIDNYLGSKYDSISTTQPDPSNPSKLTAEGSDDDGNFNVEIDAQFVGNDESPIKISITDRMQHTNANNNRKEVEREGKPYYSYENGQYQLIRNTITETTTQRQLDSDALSKLVAGISEFVSRSGGKRKSSRTRRARTRRARTRRARTRRTRR